MIAACSVQVAILRIGFPFSSLLTSKTPCRFRIKMSHKPGVWFMKSVNLAHVNVSTAL